jgi:hypothetical protein
MAKGILHAMGNPNQMSKTTIVKVDVFHHVQNFKENNIIKYRVTGPNDSPEVKKTIAPMNNPSLCDFNDILSMIRPQTRTACYSRGMILYYL